MPRTSVLCDRLCVTVLRDLEQVDANPDPRPFGTVKPFGEAYHQFSCGGWVTAVAWSPSGSILAYAGKGESSSQVVLRVSSVICLRLCLYLSVCSLPAERLRVAVCMYACRSMYLVYRLPGDLVWCADFLV